MSDIDILITLFLLCPKHTEGNVSGGKSNMSPLIRHSRLNTTYKGCRHPISSSENEIWQFRGIKYADIPGRFKQSVLNRAFEEETDATRYGYFLPNETISNLVDIPQTEKCPTYIASPTRGCVDWPLARVGISRPGCL